MTASALNKTRIFSKKFFLPNLQNEGLILYKSSSFILNLVLSLIKTYSNTSTKFQLKVVNYPSLQKIPYML